MRPFTFLLVALTLASCYRWVPTPLDALRTHPASIRNRNMRVTIDGVTHELQVRSVVFPFVFGERRSAGIDDGNDLRVDLTRARSVEVREVSGTSGLLVNLGIFLGVPVIVVGVFAHWLSIVR